MKTAWSTGTAPGGEDGSPGPRGDRRWSPGAQAWAVAWAVLAAAAATGLAAGPAGYHPRATWHETFLAAREALAAAEREAGPWSGHLAVVPVVRGGEKARRIRVAVDGLDSVYLYALGAPEVVAGCATWADARLIDAQGKARPICHLKGLGIRAPQHSIDRNLESGVSGPLRIGGRRYAHGVHVYAPARIRVPVGPGDVRLEAEVGIDDWTRGRGAVRFIVTDARGAARLDLWDRLARDFPTGGPRREMKWTREDRILEADWRPGDWADLARRYARAARRVPALAREGERLAAGVRDARGLEAVRQVYLRSRRVAETLARRWPHEVESLRLALEDLVETFGPRYPKGRAYLDRLEDLAEALPEAMAAATGTLAEVDRAERLAEALDALRCEALLANPLLDFDRLLLIRRVPHGDARRPDGTGYGLGEYIGLPRQSSKCNPNIERPMDWDNEIAVLSPVRPEGRFGRLHRPEGRRLITDLDLHWDADRLLFSMPGSHNKWQIFEIGTDGRGLRQVTPGDQPDVHNYDACYLPDDRIAFISTAPLQGVPCNASVIVGMLFTMEADGSNIRQVAFEQDHDYCPSVTNDGRILYLRWDYTDTPHVWNRMLFTMNPDGSGQMEYYGANSYWPNGIFFARAVPDHPTKVVGIVTGHHVGRVGELVLFDPNRGRFETDGVVQRIPGRGKPVEPLIQDKLTEFSWPKFLHPWPLSQKYFLVSCKPTPDALWGIYLVDVFDNMVLVKAVEGEVLLEPIPLKPRPRPPVVAPRTEPGRRDALVYLQDVYAGPGMAHVPRGTVKRLRLFTYHFGYQRIAGIDHRVGADGPWDVKRILGTVRVEADGSALFRVPAKMPLSLQPLDAEGRAVQLMRSWTTAMPGEVLSCAGCHENRGSAPPVRASLALAKPPQEIEPWFGPPRGFRFSREIQPVLDRYCVGCHDGRTDLPRHAPPDLRRDQGRWVVYRHGNPVLETVRAGDPKALLGKFSGIFPPSYIALRRLVRVGGLESDLHLLPPMEFFARTSELVQMLEKGHHGVRLDREAWQRLYTWIDLNAPCHGTWSEVTTRVGGQRARRRALQRLYGGVDADPEALPPPAPAAVEPVVPPPPPAPPARTVSCKGWPFGPAEAQRRQRAAGDRTVRTVDLGDGVTLELVRIPASRFVMGQADGCPDERPPAPVAVDRPFWMGRFEVTNRQFARFDPDHDSRFEHRTSWIFSEDYLGWPLNRPRQPVARVSWREAMAFCRRLSKRTGLRFTLPTEAQWEYACRAGSAEPLHFGGPQADFSAYANLADANLRRLAWEGWRPRSPDLVPRAEGVDDGALVSTEVGTYRPNPWGLHDMHGNVWEWTRSLYRPYPYRADDGRNDLTPPGRRVVRGGSWYDRPHRARSAFRLAYEPYQKVFNVGFRVVCEEEGGGRLARRGR